jgi:hypothetical protein
MDGFAAAIWATQTTLAPDTVRRNRNLDLNNPASNRLDVPCELQAGVAVPRNFQPDRTAAEACFDAVSLNIFRRRLRGESAGPAWETRCLAECCIAVVVIPS